MFSKDFLEAVIKSIRYIDLTEIERMVDILVSIRDSGRLFIIGSGGGAGHASHAACDFRKLCNIETYAPYDNVSELTAITNDRSYDQTINYWLQESRLNLKDCIFVFSVGGGKDGVSNNIIYALSYAKSVNAKIIAVVGCDGGKTKELADACILIVTKNYITPITEGLQAVIWHLLVAHPKLQINPTKW